MNFALANQINCSSAATQTALPQIKLVPSLNARMISLAWHALAADNLPQEAQASQYNLRRCLLRYQKILFLPPFATNARIAAADDKAFAQQQRSSRKRCCCRSPERGVPGQAIAARHARRHWHKDIAQHSQPRRLADHDAEKKISPRMIGQGVD